MSEGTGRAVEARGARNQPVQGITVACAGMFVMTVQDALVKWLTQGYPVLEIMFLRSLVMLPLVLALVAFTDGLGALRTRRPGAHLVRVVLAFMTFICFFTAVSLMPLADVMAIVFATPLFVTLLSGPLLGERVGWRRWTAVSVGFVGVLIMIGPSGASGNLWPALIALAASLLYGLWVLQTRHMAASETSAVMVFYGVAFFAVASLIGAPFGWVLPSLPDLGLFLALGVVSTVGMMLITQSYRLAPASVVVPFDYTAMIWAVILGYWIWGDVPSLAVLCGALLVIGSGLFIFHRELRAGRRRARAS